jgi:hypothetical protein
MRLQGAAHDPIPEAALQHFAGTLGSNIGSTLTPDLEWDLTIRIQSGCEIKSGLAKLRYSVADLLNLDSSDKLPAPLNLGGTSNLIHGTAYVRRFPSYVVYVTVSSDKRSLISVPVYFADASERVLGLGQIAVGQTDSLRQLTW